jgi:O-antigen/teichoic acid export membrane protein
MTDLKSENINNQNGSTSFDTARKIIKGGGIGLISVLLGRVVGLILNVLLARGLGPESFGLYALGISVVEVSVVLAMLGMGISIVRFGSIYTAKGDEHHLKGLLISSYVLTLLVSIVIAAILFLNADSIASGIFNDNNFGPVLRIMVLAIPLSVTFNMSASAAQAIKRIDVQQFLKTLIRPIIMIVLVAILTITSVEIFGVLFAYVLSMLITAILGIYFLFRLFPVLRLKIESYFELRTLLRFSIPVVTVSMIVTSARYLDRFMLGAISTTYEVGLYSAAVSVSRTMTIMLNSLTPIATPLMAELLDAERVDELSKIYQSLIYWIISLTLPIFLIILLSANEVLLLFGKDYQSASIALIILSIGVLIKVSTGPIVLLMEMGGKQDTIVIVTAIGLIISVILNFLLIPPLGGIGASISNTITAILLFGSLPILATRFIKRSLFPASIFRPILIAALAWAIATVATTFIPVSLSESIHNVINAVVCITVYAVLFLLVGLRDVDKELISLLIERAKSNLR